MFSVLLEGVKSIYGWQSECIYTKKYLRDSWNASMPNNIWLFLFIWKWTPPHLCWENFAYLERKWWLNDDQIRSLDVTDKALKFKICSPQLPFSHDPSKNVWLFFQWILFLDNFVVIALLYVIAEQQILWVLSGISLISSTIISDINHNVHNRKV